MGTKRMVILMAAVAFLALLWVASGVGAYPPADEPSGQQGTMSLMMNYQGRLLDPTTGDPKPDGTYTMTFRIYDVSTGGTALWSETKDVEVEGGVFNTILGDVTPLPQGIFTGQGLWLGVKVGADAETSPRQQLLPMPYAIYAENADTVDGMEGADLQRRVSGTCASGNAIRIINADGTVTCEADDDTTYMAGSGLSLADTTFSVNFAGSGTATTVARSDHDHSAADITSGTLSTSRFSAYDDLGAEGKIGTGSSQVAAGDHNHDARYYTESESDGLYVNDDKGEVDNADVADGALSPAKIAGTAWTSTNDGFGSGLDADKLDGKHASAFAAASHTHTGADIVDESIDTADLADGAVTSAKLANGVVPKFINLNPYGALLDGATISTGYGPFAGIHVPDSGSPDFAFGFTIPPDYTPGTPLTVRLTWHTSSTSCGIRLRPNFISVARAGRTHIVGASVSTGLDPVGGETLDAPARSNQSSAKEYTITSPDADTDLEPGDSIIFGLYRWTSSSDDTCTSDLVIQGVQVTY